MPGVDVAEPGMTQRRAAPPRAAVARGPIPRTPAKPPRAAAERPGRKALMWRRQRRLIRPALWLLLCVLAVGLVALTVRTEQSGSTVASWRERAGAAIGLPVTEVVITGREKTPEPMLRAALGVRPNDKLLGFSLDGARHRIEQLPWVQSATVERRLPGTIIVTLLERRAFAIWQSAGKFVLIDRMGQVVAEQDPAKDATAFATLPLVVGPGAPEVAAAVLDQLAAYPQLRARVVAAVRVGERRWNLHLNNGTDVLLPEGAEAAAMAKLMELQTGQQLLERPLQTIDMRLPDRLVVRPQPEPRSAPVTTTKRPT